MKHTAVTQTISYFHFSTSIWAEGIEDLLLQHKAPTFVEHWHDMKSLNNYKKVIIAN